MDLLTCYSAHTWEILPFFSANFCSSFTLSIKCPLKTLSRICEQHQIVRKQQTHGEVSIWTVCLNPERSVWSCAPQPMFDGIGRFANFVNGTGTAKIFCWTSQLHRLRRNFCGNRVKIWWRCCGHICVGEQGCGVGGKMSDLSEFSDSDSWLRHLNTTWMKFGCQPVRSN